MTAIGARIPLALASVLVLALALRVAVAALLPNVLWPDEIYQSVEQAHRLVFGYGIVPWEFREGARSWILPGALAAVVRVVSAVADSPRAYLTAIQILLASLSLVPILAAWRWASRDARESHALVAAIAAACWFELVYMAPKAFAEVVAAHVLVAALLVLEGDRDLKRAVAGGLLLGVAVALRLHLAPAVAVVLVAEALRQPRRLPPIAGGLGLAVAAAGAIDWATWGAPFHSYWTTLRANVVEGKSAQWGVLPWTGYATMLRGVWGWTALPLLGLAGLGARRRPVVLGCAVAVLLAHSAIGHKEWRFIYPATVLLVTLAAVGTASLLDWIAARWQPGRVPALAVAGAWCIGSLALATGFDSAATLQTQAGPGFSHWRGRAALLQAFDAVRDGRRPCGVGLVGVPWFVTGGYSRLHLDVPLFLVRSATDERRFAPSYDVWVARPQPGTAPDPRTVQRCWTDGGGAVCVFRRDGECAAAPGYSVNEVLEARGQ